MHPFRDLLRARRTAPWLAVALGLLAAPAAAGDEPIPSPLIEREEVRFITLDLVVSRKERDGWRPANDLWANQVQVKVGGRVMELEMFETWCGEAREDRLLPPAPASDAAAGTATGGPAAPEDRPPPPAPVPGTGEAAPPVRYILFFDFTHLKLEGYRLAFKAARTWVEERVTPQDEVMIVTGDLGLRIVRPLQPAGPGLREDLEAAFQGFLATDTWAEWEGDGNRGRIAEILSQPTPAAREALANSYAGIDDLRTRRALKNLRDLMTIFASVEGTKNLVFFEDTVRMFPGSAYPYVSELSQVDVELREVATAANERDVRIYPVDAGGLRVGTGIDDALTFLAGETGGQWTQSTNDLAAVFDRVAEDTRCAYRLGFRVPSRFTGEVARISVEILDGRRYRLRYRRTLADPTPSERERDTLRAAFLDPTSAVDFPIEASVVPLFRYEGGTRVRVQVVVALAQLLTLPSPRSDGSREARVQIGGTVLPLREAEKGGRSGSGVWRDVDASRPPWEFGRQAIFSIPGASAAGARRDVVLTEDLDAPAGSYRLVAVVQDRLAGTTAARTLAFDLREEIAALGDIHLAVVDPHALYVDGAPVADDEFPSGGRNRARLTQAPRVLPGAARVRDDAVLVAGEAAQLVFGVCDLHEAKGGTKRRSKSPEAGPPLPFQEWKLHRFLRCAGGSVPLALHARRIPAPPPGENCAIVIETLPAGTIQPGECRYEVTVAPANAPPTVRSLTFLVRPAGDGAGPAGTGPGSPFMLR